MPIVWTPFTKVGSLSSCAVLFPTPKVLLVAGTTGRWWAGPLKLGGGTQSCHSQRSNQEGSGAESDRLAYDGRA